MGNLPEFRCFLCSENTAQIAQRRAVNPHKQQSKYAPIRARQRKQADRYGSSQHIVEYLYCTLCPQNERRNRNLPGLQKHRGIHKRFTKRLSWRDVACTLLYSCSPSFLFRPRMRRAGCLRGPWSSWHLQVASLHLKLCISLSASLILRERSGRRKRLVRLVQTHDMSAHIFLAVGS